MENGITAEEARGLFEKRSSSNILSDPRILAHLRNIAEEAHCSDKSEPQDERTELEINRRELAEKIASYNKRNQLGAFKLVLKEVLNFEGALRFYFEDGNEKLTKAVRLTNGSLVSELLPTLIEKFKPDLAQSTVEKKAKLYEVYDEDEICLDPSDSPLEIALNAKKNPRFVLRLEIKRPKAAEPEGREGPSPLPNGALNSPKLGAKGRESSTVSVESTGSISPRSLQGIRSQSNSPQPSKQGSVTSLSSHGSGSGSLKGASEKARNIFNLSSSSSGRTKSPLGMFFDSSSGSQDRSAHHAHKAQQNQRRRKRSFSSLLNFRKGASSNGKQVELSTNKLAPGVLKVFGDHVSPGSNYKSVRATDLTTADEIVRQALERYSLDPQNASDYVLCDVIGYFTKPAGGQATDPDNPGKWITEYSRVSGDKERPLVLQALWKPEQGFSRRFELRRKIETQNSAFFHPRSSVSLAKGVTPLSDFRRGTGASDTTSLSTTHEQEDTNYVDEGTSSGWPSVVFSPLVAPTDTPYLLLLRGCNETDELLVHRLDEQMAVIGYHENSHDDNRPDIPLFAPDILAQHCVVSKRVETSEEDFDAEDCIVNFVAYVEPHKDAAVSINGVSIKTNTKLLPGDLLGLGSYYIFLFKDATQDVEDTLQFRWIDALHQANELMTHKNLESTNSLTGGLSNPNSLSDKRLEFVKAVNGDMLHNEPDSSENRLSISFRVEDEDDLLDMIINIVELNSECYKLTTAYLLLMCIEHSARHHMELQTRQFLLKISTAIQSIAWKRTSEIGNTIEKDTDPVIALHDLLPQLKPVIFWMSNSLELLHILQENMSHYVGDATQLPPHTDEALLNADDELLGFLEEVIMYTFQQTIYHLTKVLYVALPCVLDTNPFQQFDDDEDGDKRPQEVDAVLNIFQATYDIVHMYNLHSEIIHQLFAYLFFFTNASLFNTLIERGAGGKFYRWAKGAQIRGNLDMLESWAAQCGLQDEASHYLKRLSTAADLLATPKVQLLQADWVSIRRDFPALNPAQLQQILGEYQLGPAKSRPRGWFPPPEEVEPALRTGDILESFADHPPLSLPSSDFVLDMENGPSDSTFCDLLDAINTALQSGVKNVDLYKGLNRVQQPEPEVRGQMESRVETEFVPHVVVSAATPSNTSPKSGSCTPVTPRPEWDDCEPPGSSELLFQTRDVTDGVGSFPSSPRTAPKTSNSPPHAQTKHVTSHITQSYNHSQHVTPVQTHTPHSNSSREALRRQTGSSEILTEKRVSGRSSHGSTPPGSPVAVHRGQNAAQGVMSTSSLPGFSPVASRKTRSSFPPSPSDSPKPAPLTEKLASKSDSLASSLSSLGTKPDSRKSSMSSLVTKEENQNEAVKATRDDVAGPGNEEENYKWVEVQGGLGTSEHAGTKGLSVLPLWENSVVADRAQVQMAEPEVNFDDATALEKAEKMTQLDEDSRHKMALAGHVPVRVDGTLDRDNVGLTSHVPIMLEGMRGGDDGQDDVFIVELERGNSGLGLGLIDGLYTPLRSPGIYVRTLVQDGPAAKDGRLHLGDRILAVNGTSLVGADYQSAMLQIRNAGERLSFLVAKSDVHVAMKITASSC